MIVNISPCASSFDATLQVLQFSAIAKQVRQRAILASKTLRSNRLLAPSEATSKVATEKEDDEFDGDNPVSLLSSNDDLDYPCSQNYIALT
uniref:Kinesin motor domain-containing protein n=1 Tax=Romanomermis culicivorax TaxID=13658 RepID=A0A915JVP1_ROMCU